MRKPYSYVALAACSLVAFSVGAAVHYVSPSGNDLMGDGTLSAPWATPSHAVVAATTANGDEICLAGGLYVDSITNTTQIGCKSGLRFTGGWSRDFSVCEPWNHATIIRSISSSVPCVYLSGNVRTNNFYGLTFTGGSYGCYGNGTAKCTDRNKEVCVFDHCVFTNNVNQGLLFVGGAGKGGQGIILLSCLFARNGSDGVCYNCDSGGHGFVRNCTFAENGGQGFAGGYGFTTIEFRNCLFTRNGSYGLSNGQDNTYKVYDAIASDNNTKSAAARPEYLNYISGDGRWGYVYRLLYRGAGLDDDFRPTETSLATGRGGDVSATSGLKYPVTTDLDGNAWNGAYDLGCYKSTHAKVVVTEYADVYVDPNGDDTRAGNDPLLPLKTPAEAMFKVAVNGTIHLAAGSYPLLASVIFEKTGVTVRGAGEDVTFLEGAGNWARPAVRFCGNNVHLEDVTVRGAVYGLFFGDRYDAQNVFVSRCTLTNNTYGASQYKYATDSSIVAPRRLSRCKFVGNTKYGLWWMNDAAALPVRADNCLFACNGEWGFIDQGNSSQSQILNNCTFVENGTGDYYDTYNWGSTPQFRNCIFTDSPIALKVVQNHFQSPAIRLYSCLVNATTTNFDDKENHPHISVDEQCLVGVDPQLQTGHWLYRPKAGSPVQRAGLDLYDNALAPVTEDLAGLPRRQGKAFDLGCYNIWPLSGLQLILR